MSAAAAQFSDVLDEKVGLAAPPAPSSPRHHDIRTAPFLASTPFRIHVAHAFGGYAHVAFSRPSAASGRTSSRTSVTRIQLRTDEQRRAFETLRRLGADLPASDPLDIDVKRAFRTLARRYHPDRHPGASAECRQALAARFADASRAYAILIARG